MGSVYDLLIDQAKKNGQNCSLRDNKIYISTTNPYGDYRNVIDYDITKMYPKSMINDAYEYWMIDDEETRKICKQIVNSRYGSRGQYGIERETEMAKDRVIANEVNKMADHYGLNVEIERMYSEDEMRIRFKSKDYRTRKTFYIYNVCMRDPRVVLEDMERDVIKAFNINLNDFEPVKVPRIENVIHNDPATIVFWADNTKTVVKCQDGDVYDPEKGLAMAISKKALGNQGNYCNTFKKWLPEEDKEVIELNINNPVITKVMRNAKEAIHTVTLKAADISAVLGKDKE